MTLIKSISGIRGTIGGNVGDNLTPIDAVKFASAYGTWLKQQRTKEYKYLKSVFKSLKQLSFCSEKDFKITALW